MTTPAHTVRRGAFRGYLVNDEFHIGVTSLIRATMADPAQLARWKQKRLIELTLDVRNDLDTTLIDRDELINRVLKAQYESGPEAELGTRVHSAIEDFEAGGEMTITDPEILKYLGQWQRFKETYGLTVRWTERTLVNTKLGYAGTADGLISGDLNAYAIPYRDSFIYDIKTGKGVYDSYALQLALLAQCDAMLTPDGDLIDLEGDGWNTDYAIIAKLGPRSNHLHAVDLHAAWAYAKTLPALYEWHQGAGIDTITKVAPKATIEDLEAKRLALLERARTLDATSRQVVKDNWADTWPKLVEPEWDSEALEQVDELLAWAERGRIA